MKKKLITTLGLSAVLLVLAACTRSASSTPVSDATEDPIESIFSTVATQTALAALNEEESAKDVDLTPTAEATEEDPATATPESTATTTPAPVGEVIVPASYTLHEGEWPYCLARRFNIDASALLAANGLTENQAQNLSVGTTLNIPAGAAAFSGARQLRQHPTTYTASGADSFYSIACQFGDVWPQQIADANGRDVDYEPAAGEQLHIP